MLTVKLTMSSVAAPPHSQGGGRVIFHAIASELGPIDRRRLTAG